MGLGLLATSINIQEIWAGIVSFFTEFKPLAGVEIVLFFALIFFVSKVLRDNEATKLMVVYWFMLVIGGVLPVLDDQIMDKRFFVIYVVLLSGCMLILFNTEVKKIFWDTQESRLKLTEKSTNGSTEIVSKADTERHIGNIVKALQNMSKNNIGALIVLSKGVVPKHVLQSGVELNAEISTQLIEGIFFPKAPLHDGAMVIQGHKIQAAGCFLPLTQKTSYPKEYGTRHRAAIGITEVANVVSLVVSEETGIISIVKQGSVTRYADYEMLEDALKDYYWQEMPLTDKKVQRR